MKKKIVYGIVLLLLFVACALPFIRVDHSVSFDVMKKEVETLIKTYQKDFKQEDETFIRKFYQLNEFEYSNQICYGAPSAMEVNEITVLHYEDEQYKDHIVSQLQKRIDEQYKSFAGYAPRQAELLKNAIMLEKKNYVILIVHEASEDIKAHINALF